MNEDKTATFSRDDLERSISQGLSASLIIASVVLSAYSIVLSSNYGLLDDYTLLNSAVKGSNDTLALPIGSGRPLDAGLIYLGFHLAGSIENLAVLRAITLVGIWLLGCGLYFFSRLHCARFISSLAIACGIILLPSFQVYASWATLFATPFAGSIALSSAFILTPACAMHERSRVLAFFLSVLLLLTAVLIYQPIAMLFCTGILISVFSKPSGILSDWKPSRIIDAATAFLAALFLGFIIFKVGHYIYPSGALRYNLVPNIYSKLTWVFSEPIANALSLYSVPRNATAQFAIILAVSIGSLFLCKKYSLKTGSRVILYGILCLIGSYAPSLVTAENWASYRSTSALSASVFALLVILAFESIDFIQRKYSNNVFLRLSDKHFWLVPAIVLVIVTSWAQSNVLNGFVLPNVTELNNLASLLHDGKRLKLQNVTVIIRPSSWTDSAAKPLAYDEFGMPSSIHDYYAKAIVELALRSANLIPKAIIVTSGDAITNQQSDGDENLVIDFPRLVTSQRFKTTAVP
jgi:hypothetical protein